MLGANHKRRRSWPGWLISITSWCVFIFVLDHVDGGRSKAYLDDHLWLLLVPLTLIFLVLFVRSYYLQYKQ